MIISWRCIIVNNKYCYKSDCIQTYPPRLTLLPQLQLAQELLDSIVQEVLREPDNGGEVDYWFWGGVELY